MLGIYNLSELDKLIYRKNNYNKIEYIIKLFKEKNIELKDYRQEAKNILSIENISNYSLYIDEKYLNKKELKKYVLNAMYTIMAVKIIKMCNMKNLKKTIVIKNCAIYFYTIKNFTYNNFYKINIKIKNIYII